MSVPPEDSPQVALLSRIRHKLRTPLNQIIGYSELLLEDAKALEQKSFINDLQNIHGAARQLLMLINESLIPSYLFAENLVLPPEDIDVSKKKKIVVELAKSTSSRLPKYLQQGHGHLLIVDDDQMNRDMLAQRLKRDGYTVSMAENGRQALELAKTQKFDLILLDILMPEMNGYQVLEHLKGNKEVRHIPVIMISALDEIDSVVQCIEIGAEDYLAKPFDPVLLRARIGASLEKKMLRDQEQIYYQALSESQKRLAAELLEAANYVKSLLPAPLKGEIKTEWRFIPSTQLGGDSFGYHWLDDEHFAMYLLDVCGHGVGAALLSVSVMNVLRSQSLPSTDFRDPSAVLNGLNEAFQMENQNNMYFTIWYGVYNKTRRQIVYTSGGHPPAILLTGPAPEKARVEHLRVPGLVVGSMPKVSYRSASCDLEVFSKLYLFSDGAYEITQANGLALKFDEFVKELAIPSPKGVSDVDRMVRYVQELSGSGSFEDDVSIMQLVFE